MKEDTKVVVMYRSAPLMVCENRREALQWLSKTPPQLQAEAILSIVGVYKEPKDGRINGQDSVAKERNGQ